MSVGHDVIVAGAGIAGLTAALALADAGHDVLVIDDMARAGGASRASAGLLGASLGFAPAVAPIAIAARETYPRFLEALHEATGIRVALDRGGIVEVAEDDPALERLHGSAPVTAQRLGAADLARLDARLARHAGGLFHPHDGAVDNVLLMDALARAGDRHPRVSLELASVVALDAVAEGVSARTHRDTRFTAARLVLAAGAWAGGIAGLPRPLPVRPVRGELMVLDVEPMPLVVHGAGGYLLPRGGALLVGATSDDDGFAARTSEAGRATLAAIAERLGGIPDAPVLRHWAGLRPVTPDGLPVLGADGDWPALVYATGYSRNGILLAPWAAARLVREVGGEGAPELAPFRITRFGG